MEQRNPEVRKQLERVGMLSGCPATEEQLAIIESLSSQEVSMLIGLRTRLESAEAAPTECSQSGYLIW
ncbi:hypothetical protein SAMN05216532_8184 [Streptomyces sp. 2231.1]|uniref:hypothetical protein n=1 Tax=Streptomyces sp. 2231.1 TaxID=1855347 RepID=UPI000896CC13|nr:hypothetical protein [Streptomyces sp. 2231.1]SEE65628.1 hypothetical protein SAMN05216532_8184 [Streptomyces sp. 2231.1]